MPVEAALVVAKPQGQGDQVDIFIGCVQALGITRVKACAVADLAN